MSSSKKMTKKERREARRAAARAEREKQMRREKRQKILKRVLMVLIPAAIILGIVALVATRAGDTVGPAPSVANDYGGIKLTSSDTIEEGNATEVDLDSVGDPKPNNQGGPAETPPGAEAASEGEPANVVIYADANCIHCAEFDQSFRDLLGAALDDGTITMEYRLVNFLDVSSPDNYSTRAATAATCVADQDPSSYQPFVEDIFDAYGTEPSNEELVNMAGSHDVDITECMNEGTYATFVDYTSATALSHGVQATPSVWINGKSWADSGQDFPTFFVESIT